MVVTMLGYNRLCKPKRMVSILTEDKIVFYGKARKNQNAVIYLNRKKDYLQQETQRLN